MSKILYLGLLAYDGRLMASTYISTMNFLKEGSPHLSHAPFVNIVCGVSHVDRARNQVCKNFLDAVTYDGKKATHLLFIDSDIGYCPEHINMLLERDEPVVCGLYAKKEVGPPQWVVNIHEDMAVPDATGLAEVKYAGTGFLMIAREALEKMIEHNDRRMARLREIIADRCTFLPNEEDGQWLDDAIASQNMEYEDDSAHKLGKCWAFFDAGVRHNRFLTEDWMFSDNWLRMGGKIYADTRCALTHVGQCNYPIPEKEDDLSSGA